MTRRSRATALALLALVTLSAALPPHSAPPRRARRQLPSEDTLQPLENDSADSEGEQVREKRKLEAVTQVKFGAKNALLGLVFGKINKAIDAKTRLIDKLDRTNVAKNKAYNIQPPASPITSISNLFSSVVGPKLAIIGPKIGSLTNSLGGASGSSSGGGGGGGATAGASVSVGGGGGGSGSGLGSILSLVTSLSGSSSGSGSSGGGTGGGGGGSAGGIGSLLSLVTSLVGTASGGGGIINAGAAGGVDTIDSSEEDDE